MRVYLCVSITQFVRVCASSCLCMFNSHAYLHMCDPLSVRLIALILATTIVNCCDVDYMRLRQSKTKDELEDYFSIGKRY